MKVSILIPCYNVAVYLPQCLDSVINQTHQDLQIVLVDDGSMDNTLAVAQQYAAKDSRIEVYHQENQGVAAARNVLLSKIKGDYFLFVDSDDWIEPGMVEYLLSQAIECRAEMVTCGLLKNDADPSRPFSEEIWSQDKTIKEFLRHVDFNGSLWNKLVSVTLLHNEPRFNRSVSYGEDALFCWELLKEVKTVVVTDCPLYYYRMNADSLSHLNWTPEKKGSGSITWRLISEDVSKRYPQYADIANARNAIEDMWGLYYAALANYPYGAEIIKRQKHVRESFRLIKHSGLVSKNKLFFALLISRWYGFGWVLRTMKKIKV